MGVSRDGPDIVIISITRSGKAKRPLLTVKTEEKVLTAKDALRVALTKAGGDTRPAKKKGEKDAAYLARLLGIKPKGRR